MQGFTDKAIILFPKYETYEFRPYGYKYNYRKAVDKMIKYLNSCGIDCHMFYTDDIARDLSPANVTWVSSLNMADRFFVSKHCDGMTNAMSRDILQYPEIYERLADPDVDIKSMSESERFNNILSNNFKNANEIIKEYKVIVHFSKQRENQYQVKPKNGDGKVIIEVSVNNFVPKTYMSGSEVSPIDLLARGYANRAVDVWEI